MKEPQTQIESLIMSREFAVQEAEAASAKVDELRTELERVQAALEFQIRGRVNDAEERNNVISRLHAEAAERDNNIGFIAKDHARLCDEVQKLQDELKLWREAPPCPGCKTTGYFVRDRNFKDGSGRVYTCTNPKCVNHTLYFYPDATSAHCPVFHALEVGKKYRTRDGETVIITGHDPSRTHAFSGTTDPSRTFLTWMPNGQYNVNRPGHRHDIVAALP